MSELLLGAPVAQAIRASLEERIARLEHMQMTGQYPTEGTI